MMYLAVGFLWLCHFLPFRVLAGLGRCLGYLLYWAARPRRKVGLINLRLCFPEWTEAQRRQVICEHFQLLTISMLERSYLWWSSAERLKRLVSIEGLEHYDAVKAGPVILFAPHFVGLDMGGPRITLAGLKGASMYSKQNNPLLDKMLLHGRSRFGDNLFLSRQDGLRKMLKTLKQGYTLYYLPDQDFGAKDSVFVPFFGVPTATITGMSRLAAAAKAALVPCIVLRKPDGSGYTVRFYPAWDNYPSEDEVADTRRMNAFLEERILEAPAQYFWLHKRFKTRPEGEERPY